MDRMSNIGHTHFGFLQSRNYNSATDLEALGLVASESTEALQALIEHEGEEKFHEEVADIGLRAIGIIYRYPFIIKNPDWLHSAIARVRKNESWVNYLTPQDAALRTLFPVAAAMNEARKAKPSERYFELLTEIMALVVIVSEDLGIDLAGQMEKKIKKNHSKPPSDRIK